MGKTRNVEISTFSEDAVSLCPVKTKISALNKDVNLVDCAALKATLLAGGRGVRESP